ncbi:hypothetical protein I8H84_04840 [Candidatus Saccharibacteria bacterium]|nr:hypothetical protein [Candidatus Saccharibacteria bacterium]MBH1973339.1 hypothetical protein [Candidatus Saccharibacteria bacterium]OGL24095.1 MAG: hypothetical protein A2791_04305 [Candidatus Saccharibacteria bacterium RIFCSPHIGHO2_01_FULL_46_30]
MFVCLPIWRKAMQLTGETTVAVPLTWHSSEEKNVLQCVRFWLKENPDDGLDDKDQYALRTIVERLSSYDNPNPRDYEAEVTYETILASIVRNKDLIEDTEEFKHMRAALDNIWSEIVPFFNIWFTKITPHTPS